MTAARGVVTVSATYGAGGTVVAPLVAEKLGLPLLERVVTPDIARELRGPLREGLNEDERPDAGWRHFVAALSRLPALFGSSVPQPEQAVGDEDRLRYAAEHALRDVLATGGVAMGRAAMVVLKGEPGVFHVRLDGPVGARIRQGMEIEGVDEPAAARRQADTDAARMAYVERFYGVDPHDPTLYHLVVDSTAVPLRCVADLVATAARGYWAGTGDGASSAGAAGGDGTRG